MATGIFTTKQQAQGVRQKLWTTTVAPSFVDALVVAGGGGSPGGTNAGGGGGGGFVNSIVPVITGSALTVTVGAGGTAGANGSNSVFRTTGASGGGTSNTIGGSGGGTAPASWPYGPSIQGLFGQGNAGGPAQLNADGGGEDSAGGGGGAGSTGSMGKADARGGGGGYGAGSIITGTTTAYAGGGGGSMQNSSYTIGNGGAGGGGTGASGTANTGGGAGTAYGSSTNGGSGVVVISYPDVYAAAASTTGSPTVSTSGSGSIYFDGTGDSLGVPSSANLSFGTGDFTIEGWVYLNSVSGFQTVFSIRISGSDATTGHYSFAFRNTALEFYASGGVVAQGGTASTSTWTHVACTRSSGSVRLFLNGTQVGSTASFATSVPQNAASVASNNANTENLNGYISNLRILKGTAQYTANFTVPTAPLTAITNTQFLLNTVSGAQFADASSNSFVLTKNGDTAWNQLSPFATGTGYKNRVYRWTSSGSITF